MKEAKDVTKSPATPSEPAIDPLSHVRHSSFYYCYMSKRNKTC